MRILIVGEDQPWAIERSYASAFRQLGASVELFDWWSSGAPGRRRDLARRPLWPLVARRANRLLILAAERYDVIFVFKGLLVDKPTVQALRADGRVAVCFNPDNPWEGAATNYSPASEAAMSSWDAYLIWSQFLVSRLYSAGCKRVEVVPFVWDPEAHPYREVTPAEEKAEIVFAANWSPHRERWIVRLSDFPIALYGRAWAKALRRMGRTNFRVRPEVPVREAYAEAIAHARVALNIMNAHNCPGLNMRTFEIPGVGGVTCSTWTEDVEELFPDGAVATFRTESDLRSTLSWLFDDTEARTEIRRRSHEIARQHTVVARSRDLLRVFDELLLERQAAR